MSLEMVQGLDVDALVKHVGEGMAVAATTDALEVVAYIDTLVVVVDILAQASSTTPSFRPLHYSDPN